MRTRSLQTKIFTLSFVLVLIPVMVLSLATVVLSIRASQEEFREAKIQSMRRIGASLDYMFSELNSATMFLIANDNVQTYLSEMELDEQSTRFYSLLRSSMNTAVYLSMTSNYIKSIDLFGNNGQIIRTGAVTRAQLSDEDRAHAVRLEGRSFWNTEDISIGYGNTEKCIYECRLLRNPSKIQDASGIMKIYLNNGALAQCLKNEGDSSTSYFLIDNFGNRCFSYNAKEKIEAAGITVEQLLNNHLACLSIRQGMNQYIVTPYRITQNGWLVYGICSMKLLSHQTSTSLLTFLTMTVLCFCFCLGIAYVYSHKILRPLMNIVNHMKSIENEDFSVRIQVEGDNQLSILSRQFNRMAEKIQSLINEVYLVTIRKREAELRALQEQINPHFLYNTLDSIYWTAKLERADQTGELIRSLSCLFRLALKNVGEFSTIEDEVEHLKYYIALQQRTCTPFSCEVEVTADAIRCRVVKLALQPIVENAIVHGIAGKEDGCISIRIERNGELLLYTVSDNGPGLNPEGMVKLLEHHEGQTSGFGVRNVNDRIRLAYGDMYGIAFYNAAQGGSIVRVTQPFLPLTQEQEEAP